MEVFVAFLLAVFFSFVGSIPPGTINLTILQLGLDNKMKVAWRFAITAAIIEYPFAWIAVKFERWITSSPIIIENIQLITAIVMIVLGIFNLWSSGKPTTFSQRYSNSGFRRGIVLSILNPLALPYWVGITAYLRNQNWIDLSTPLALQGYLIGVVIGSGLLLILLAYLATKVSKQFQQNRYVKKIPGVMLLALGLYALIQYLL